MMHLLFLILLGLFVISGLMSVAGIALSKFLIILMMAVPLFTKAGRQSFIQIFKGPTAMPFYFVIGFVAWGCLSYLWIPNPNQNFLKYSRNFDWALLLLSLTILLVSFPPKIKLNHLKSIVVFTTVIGLYGVVQMFTQLDLVRDNGSHMAQYGDFFRATGFFKSPLTYGYLVGMYGTIGVAVLLLSNQGRRQNWLYYMGTVVGGFAVLASNTRGAWLAVGVGLVVTSLLVNRRHIKMIASSLIIAVTLLSFNHDFRRRIGEGFDFKITGNNTDRLSVWSANLQMFVDNPWMGVGIGRNVDLLPEYYQKLDIPSTFYNHAHNDFLQILSTTGAPGLIFYLLFSFWFLRQAYLNTVMTKDPDLKVLSVACLMSQIIFQVGSLTQCNFFDSEIRHVLVLIWALTLFNQIKNQSSSVGVPVHKALN